jgi:hypothetical protein
MVTLAFLHATKNEITLLSEEKSLSYNFNTSAKQGGGLGRPYYMLLLTWVFSWRIKNVI